MENKERIGAMLILFAVFYLISPIDLAPGVLDDILVMAAAIVSNKKLRETA